MPGVVITGNSTLELVDGEDPTPGPTDVALEINASGMLVGRSIRPKKITAALTRKRAGREFSSNDR